MPLCQQTNEKVLEIVFHESRLRINLISQTAYFNLSQDDALRKCFVSTFSKGKMCAFCCFRLHLAGLGIGSSVIIGSNVQAFQ